MNSLKINATLEEFGMMRFTKGLMWVIQEVFGLEKRNLLCEPDEREGRYILSQIMRGGNFGHHDDRLKNKASGKMNTIRKILKHNFHLLTHYPSDVIWTPVWIVWHWGWKRIAAFRMNKKD